MNASEKDQTYWSKQLSDAPPPPNLPFEKKSERDGSAARETFSTTSGVQCYTEIRSLAARAATTPQVVLLAALQALVYRYTGQTDLVCGTLLTGNSMRLNS